MKIMFFTALVLAISPNLWAAGEFDATKAKLEAGLAGSIRVEADTVRDANRKPIEVLEFFGFRENTRVLELSPGGGWWTKFLAPTLMENGEYYVAVGVNDNLKNNLLSKPGFEKVQVINGDVSLRNIESFSFEESNMDLVLTFWNLHNMSPEGRANLNKAVLDSLKPGGLYGVVDHTRRHGEPTKREVRAESNGRRLDPVLVIKEMVDSGFEFVDFSDMHHHSEDGLNKEVGQPGVRGNTDRFTLLFRKPE